MREVSFNMKRNRSLSTRPGRIVLIVTILLIGILFHGFFNRLLQVIQIPLVSSATWITQRVGLFQDAEHLTQEEVARLKELEISYDLLVVQQDAMKSEYEQLKKTLGFVEKASVRPLGAAIVGRTNQDGQSRLVINRGAEDGIRVGAPVIVEQGLYVGKVRSVSQTQSIVSTLTDLDHATAVSLLNETRTIGLIKGLNGNLTVLDFIPLDEKIEVDNLVVTSGLEEFIPSGLLVGYVNTVRPDQNGPFQEAVVEPMIDIRRYSSVVVLLPLTL